MLIAGSFHLAVVFQLLPVMIDLVLYLGDQIVRQMAEPALPFYIFGHRPQWFRAVCYPVMSVFHFIEGEYARSHRQPAIMDSLVRRDPPSCRADRQDMDVCGALRFLRLFDLGKEIERI